MSYNELSDEDKIDEAIRFVAVGQPLPEELEAFLRDAGLRILLRLIPFLLDIEGFNEHGGREMSDPNEIIGHKTFDTGETCPKTGFPKLRHEPLTRSEADAIWKACEAEKAARAERMPDEQAAIRQMHDAYTRLQELGWRAPSYCPKDGSHFKVIEPGSTGIHDANYMGDWPKGAWWVYDGDTWPSRPVLFRLYPEDQAKEDQRWAEARERFKASGLIPATRDMEASNG